MSQNKKRMSVDGNFACADSAYAFTEVAGIYPITPSSTMAEYTDEWASQGKKNLFDMPVRVVEMQSEAGAAGTVHGSLEAGALTTTFTASQGLLLKIPNMYKIAGECLPGVIHVSARSIASQALSIFGDHQDVMAARQTGFVLLCSNSVQEAHDLAAVAHLCAIDASLPFLHFFDGFRTSHEVNTIEKIDYSVFKELLNYDKLNAFRKNSLNPMFPKTRGTAQNDDIYFQTRELQAKEYAKIPDLVNDYMAKLAKHTGRVHKPFEYYGHEQATDIIVAMGSICEATKEVIDYLMAKGEKVGLVCCHLFRPFSKKYFLDVVPKSVERISVLDRTIEPGSLGEPLFLDIKSVFYEEKNQPMIIGGRYGLSSKDTTPDMIYAVYKNLRSKDPIKRFTLGIHDDIDHTSLDFSEHIDVADKSTIELLFFGLGSDGTVGACKNISKIIGDYTDLYAQSYAAYDSKKSGGSTRLHLRFSQKPIRSTYLVNNPHFVSCSLDAYLNKFDMLHGLREGGSFLLNTPYTKDEIVNKLPNKYKRILAERKAKFYIIDADKTAMECGFRRGLGINTVMQSAFFKLHENLMDNKEAVVHMKEFACKTYTRKGQEAVEQNYKAIDLGSERIVEIKVDPSWANLKDEVLKDDPKKPKFVRTIIEVMDKIQGDTLPLSVFKDYRDAHIPAGMAAYEKRGIATEVPLWDLDACIQCNQCAFACPHACIRPFLLNDEEKSQAPENAKFLPAVGFNGMHYAINVSVLDCTGCGVCINVCPGKAFKNPDGSVTKRKALSAQTLIQSRENKEVELADFFYNKVEYRNDLVGTNTAKNVSFRQPLFEFSGACGGCGETPYLRAVTQLFGDKMMIANATGCSSIYSGSYPSSPYAANRQGRGPAWGNSLFEDNAEFGFGMRIASETIRDRIQNLLVNNLSNMSNSLKEVATCWIENRDSSDKTNEIYEKLVSELEKDGKPYAKELLDLKQYFIRTSQWIIGGDGWAYDIGYGGLDHVIANNQDVNILVLDTEVYSNTGGQSSKSSRFGAIAKFAAAGKPTKKKDLAKIAITYGHVYVAQISLGYNQNQVIKALKEAEAYKGPSVIIAYSPCIAHNIKKGLYMSQNQSKLAVECGYWPVFRYNPDLRGTDTNPFTLDCKEPDFSKYEEFLMNEGRYSQLMKLSSDKAKELIEDNIKDAKEKFDYYKKLAE